MGYTYKSTVSGPQGDGDRLSITRCDEGHLQMVVTSGSQTGLICVKPEDVAEITDEMQGYVSVAEGEYPVTTLTLRDQLAAAEAELRAIAEQARAAHRAWADLDQKQTRKADEIRDLHRQIREEADQ